MESKGHVVDPRRAPMAGVQVQLSNSAAGTLRKVSTDADGDFTFPGLPVASSYRITALRDWNHQ